MRKHNYVVGYEGDGQCVYGVDDGNCQQWINPVTLYQAKKMSKKIITPQIRKPVKSVVYKLVKV